MEDKKITQVLCKRSYETDKAKITKGNAYSVVGYENSGSRIIRIIDDRGINRGFDAKTFFDINSDDLYLLEYEAMRKLFDK